LRAERQLLRLDDTDNHAICTEGIIGGTVCGRKLRDRVVLVRRERHAWRERHDVPAGSLELRVNQALAGQPLGILLRRSHTNALGGEGNRLYRASFTIGMPIKAPGCATENGHLSASDPPNFHLRAAPMFARFRHRGCFWPPPWVYEVALRTFRLAQPTAVQITTRHFRAIVRTSVCPYNVRSVKRPRTSEAPDGEEIARWQASFARTRPKGGK
jgi:hypothetical protein